MRLNRTYLFIILSSLALVVVLIIQVNWILRAAETKRALFNEKAGMVLTRTAEAFHYYKKNKKGDEHHIGDKEKHIIDSLLQHYMRFYSFHLDYRFDPRPAPFMKKTGAYHSLPPLEPACYGKNLEDEAHMNGFELKLIFPEQKTFIWEEVGTVFISSVILIILVLVILWRTTGSLLNEKKVFEHTNDFLNNMTHEFKTPLTNIALAGKMLVKDPGTEQGKVKHYTGIILDENEKLRLQVEHVLSMTALERGEIPMQRTEIDLHIAIQEAVKRMNIQVENRDGKIATTYDAQHFVVMGDKTHIANVLSNLLENAVKYSAGAPEISIRTYNEGQNLFVEISDKGIGIEDRYREKVFDKFFRIPTGNVHNVKGFGLGLAYTKKVIGMLGGAIELHSEKGMGTTFKITLPYV